MLYRIARKILSMRSPLTKYGLPQVLIYPALELTVIIVLFIFGSDKIPAPLLWSIEAVLILTFIWQLSFFRDPKRVVPEGDDFLISPADGTITDIQEVSNEEFIGEEAVRIGIFLSVFNVHINRVPADVRVENIVYRPGKFLDARNLECSRVNEANDLHLTMTKQPHCKLIVRQISGAIARRIVCQTKIGDSLKIGQKYGMIKYGSRTELYIPKSVAIEILVEVGDKVKAGTTKLVEFK